ncbi:MAG: phosphoglycerate dehydrogenase [Oscillospiraceae bacterium]|jgi:D-3-phosphoglycerate dehydrogenase|nr:phosphoglycerate dehydrogenase [Oscillospiraceae bacterium]
MQKVMVFPSTFGKFSKEPERLLTEAGIEFTRFSKAGMTEDEVIQRLQGYDGVILGLEPMSERVMHACPQLKVVSRFGVGMDNVDVKAAGELGVKVYNTPGANANAVADYAFGMMLDLARSISVANRDVKRGEWNKYTGYPVWGAALGIIGLGAIGKGMARRAKGFNMRVLAYDVYWDEAFMAEYGVEKASLDEIYDQADFITLHTALTEETRNMISTEQLKRMKNTAFLINCARGGLVDEDALADALRTGEIAGVGIDAFCDEPPTGSPLLEMDCVIAAPHIAGSSIDGINTMARMSAQNCIKGLQEVRN